MNRIAIDQRQVHRYRARLLFGGMPFRGTVEELRAADILVDQAAHTLQVAQPESYPSGTGKARQALLDSMRMKFEEGITPADVEEWLAQQDWSVYQ